MELEATAPTAFLIDMDGLLLDTERVSLKAWKAAEKETGITLPEGFQFSIIGQSMKVIRERMAEEMGSDFDVAGFIECSASHYHRALESSPVDLKPGAGRFLQYLAEHEIPRCLATSTERYLADRKLKKTGLDQWLPHRVCGDEIESGKPHPDIYLTAAAKLGFQPSACIAVEDSENGIRAAHAAGCTVIHIPDMAPVSLEIQLLTSGIWRSLEDVVDAMEARRGLFSSRKFLEEIS